AEQETLIVRERDGLDLAAQPPQRVAVDAREQPALAPLLDLAGRKLASIAAAHREALLLEGRERRGERGRRQAERRGELGRRHRPERLEAAADDLAQRVIRIRGAARQRRRVVAGGAVREREPEILEP